MQSSRSDADDALAPQQQHHQQRQRSQQHQQRQQQQQSQRQQQQPPQQQRRRSQLPPLAPRNPQSLSSRDRSAALSTATGSGRPARLSHRSRAGCWTCRGRKVKCDEVHPRCGPCTRLDRECDWDHRWNFSDSTSTTQNKYNNVTTAGNAVWDPNVRTTPSPNPFLRQPDDLPAFAILTNDEDRERKAETQRPGTYGVVVTPNSFADLPEYASTSSPVSSRRTSVQFSHSASFSGPVASALSGMGPFRSSSRRSPIDDPNVVVLDRFEDNLAAHVTVPSPIDAYTPLDRRYSLPSHLRAATISASPPPPPPGPLYPTVSRTPAASNAIDATNTTTSIAPSSPGNSLFAHFRRYIVPLIVQPLTDDLSGESVARSFTRDVFEIEASRYPPLHQAICALSALNISVRARSSMASAHQHYSQALTSQSLADPDEALSDGAFFRHFLLFLYDICDPTSAGTNENDLWAQHLTHLKNIAVARRNRLGQDPHTFFTFIIMALDTAAGMMGNGSCKFVNAMVEHGMVPSVDQQASIVRPALTVSMLPEETATFQDIIVMNQVVMVHASKLAQAAQIFRAEATAALTAQSVLPHHLYVRWQRGVAKLQEDLHTSWALNYPKFLAADQPQASMVLSSRVRVFFEHAFLLFQASVIYSRTSMFPSQRTIPASPLGSPTDQKELNEDTERRIATILALTINNIEHSFLDRHWIVFPIFMAGFATLYSDAKVQALELLRAMQGCGIGTNVSRTRQLLKAVVEEQSRKVDEGGRMEDVDWLLVARQRGLNVVNCGL